MPNCCGKNGSEAFGDGHVVGCSNCWYEAVQGSELQQGDILPNYPLVRAYIVQPADGKPDSYVAERYVIILTQTCDILKDTQETVLVAEVEDYDTLCRTSYPHASSDGYRKKLIENAEISLFLLHEHKKEPLLPWSTVSFRDLHVSPKSDLRLFAQPLGLRLRLRSPYKEHLSQSFARFIMRVGLPVTNHAFKNYQPARSPAEKTA